MPDFKPDTSIYGGFKPPGMMSPQEMLNTAYTAQQVQGRAMLGDIYKSATDPVTGQYDPNKVIARANEAGVLAPELVTRALENANQGAMLDHAKLQASREAWLNMGQLVAAHVNDPDFNASKMNDIIMQFIADPRFGGVIGHQAAVQMMKGLYNPATGKPDDAKAQKLARNLISMTMTAYDQTRLHPYGVDKNGNEMSISYNAFLVRKANERAGLSTPEGLEGPVSGAPGAGAPGVSGRTVLGPSEEQPVTTKLSPERQEIIKTSGAMQSSDVVGSQSFPADMGTLSEALRHAISLGPQGTGPWKDKINEIKTGIQAFAPNVARWLNIDPKEVADFNQLKKYLTVAMQQRANNLGGANSDMQLASFVSGNPNVNMDQMSIVDMLKYNIALRRAEQARQMALNSPHHPAQNPLGHQGPQGPLYAERATHYNNNVDIRGFAVDMMKADDIEALRNSLSPGERRRFDNAAKIGRQTGVMNF